MQGPCEIKPFRPRWLPDAALNNRSLKNNTLSVHISPCQKVHVRPVAQFERAIESDPEMVDLINQAFLQASSQNQIPDFDSLLSLLDDIVVSPPEFRIYRDAQGNRLCRPIGVPVFLLFDLLSNTCAGYDLFRMPAFNSAAKALLDSWGQYLTTKDSRKSLTEGEGGWFSKEGLGHLESNGRGKFEETYICPDPTVVDRGFSSWDAFFTREVQPHARPVEAPYDPHVIHNACESSPYYIARDVKLHDRFWLKGKTYSLYNMLGRDDGKAKQFVGGTVYQAFLSPADYHRWRSPIDGIIDDIVLVPGTYLAALPDAGSAQDSAFAMAGEHHGALPRCLSWLGMVATRMLIYIKASNPDIGLMCFIAVGMTEVSTCEATVRRGQKVRAGHELGMFHYGGSSYAMVFRPETQLAFAQDVVIDKHIKVNSILARVSRGHP